MFSQFLGQGRGGGGFEEGAQGNFFAQGLAETGRGPGRQQGVSPQGEEIVMPADLAAPEQLGPEVGNGLLPGRSGRLKGGCRGKRRQPGTGQRPLVHLAIGREGEGVEEKVGRGEHVIGQTAGEMMVQCGGRKGLTGDDVGGQGGRLLARRGDGPHQGVLHRGMLPERVFDFSRLDAEAPQLELAICTGDEFDSAVAAPSHQIASKIKPLPATAIQRIGQKSLRSQTRAMMVAPGQARPADKQHPHDAWRHGLECLIHHMTGCIGDREADGDRRRVFGRIGHLVPGGEGGGFGRAINMEKSLRRTGFQNSPHPMGRYSLAAEKKSLQRGKCGGAMGRDEVEESGGEEEGVDAFAGQEIGQGVGIQRRVPGKKNDRAAVEQRRPHLEGGGVKRGVCGLSHPLSGQNLQIIGRLHQPRHGPMGDDHAFGAPGRAGGVDDVGRVFGINRDGGICRGL